MKAKKNYTNFCLLVILSLCFSCKQSENHTPVAKDGYLDLSDWDFEKNGVVTLDGAWEFYWNKLYTPQDFERDSLLPKTGYINVPGNWNKQRISGHSFPAKGYATYRLKIKLNQPGDILAIKLSDASSSYKLWINDKLVATNGIVDSVPSKMKPQYLPMVKSFHTDSEKLDLIIQVSNNFHSKGGLWLSIQLGTQEQLMGKRDFSAFFNVFLCGVFFFLFIYHLWIYFLRNSEKASLWFGLLCLTLLVRDLVTGERFLYVLFPSFDLNIGLRLEYLPLCLGPTLYAIFTAHLFPQEFPKKALPIILWLTAVETIIILFTPTSFYTDLLIWFELTLVIKSILTIIIIIKSTYNKRLGALPFLVSMLILMAFAIRDILFSAMIINTGDIVPLGFFISVLAQTYVLAYRISFAFGEVEELSVNLEKKVEERTRELSYEKKKSDELLLNILPEEVAEELKAKGTADAKQFDDVTVMFTDFKGFTQISERLSPSELVAEIHTCFKEFDNIIGKHNIEKIKTIGDAYMCAGGLPVANTTNATDVVQAALEIQKFMLGHLQLRKGEGKEVFEIRIGIHTGPVVAGIVGVKKFAYDIWGDTVNIASRMESSGEAGKVNISGSTYELVKDKFKCEYRGKIEAKNKGQIDMYFVEEKA